MMNIIKNSDNIVVLNLTNIDASDIFLFELINDISNTSITFIANNISTSKTYQKFIITESATVNLLTSHIHLNEFGLFTCKIYKQVSSTNLITSNATFIESIKCKVLSDTMNNDDISSLNLSNNVTKVLTTEMLHNN